MNMQVFCAWLSIVCEWIAYMFPWAVLFCLSVLCGVFIAWLIHSLERRMSRGKGIHKP